MKILIAYPPLDNQKGCPTLGQNRQFQYFKEKTLIYPVVPATAATMLKQAGHEVIWLDCIAEGISYSSFLEIICREKPDLIAFETKTPVIKQQWRVVDEIKQLSAVSSQPSAAGRRPLIVLFGDHVTALPEESFHNSRVDFVLTGGDYDFLLLNLCNAISVTLPTTYDLLSTELEPGIYYRDNGQVNPSTALRINGERPFDSRRSLRVVPSEVEGRSRTIKNTGKFQLNHDLNSAPFIDRKLTKWENYACKNGNYKRIPGTYIMSGRDCWWGQCSFCSWGTLYPRFRVRSVENVADEIDILTDKYKVREIMDDTGCFPAGAWLREFCAELIKRGLQKRKFYLDCNMRFGALSDDDFKLMKKANFRLLLFGLESANQITLDRINKNLKAERIIEDCKAATGAGLFPHITIMFGYPWESHEDALKTLKLGTWLLKKGYAYTMQATMVIPYPGTPLFDECRVNGQLKTIDWDDYDMKQPVMRSPVADEKLMGLVQGMYKISFNPEFIARKIASLNDIDDIKYWFRAAKKVFGHIFDFTNQQENKNAKLKK